MTLPEIFQAVTLFLVIVAFWQRQRLVKKEDLDGLKEDMKEALTEVRKTNGRLTRLEIWKENSDEQRREDSGQYRRSDY